MNSTEQAHQNLRNILLNGRILLNGLALTGLELNGIIAGEQSLYEKAVKLDSELVAKQKAPGSPNREPNVVPITGKKEK